MPLTKNQLKPDIHLNIATYHIYGEMNKSSVDELLNRIENHLYILRGMHIKGLLFSFENVTKIDRNALLELINGFGVFHVKMRARIGFCDYSDKMYNALRMLVLSTPLGLYRDVEVMSLAVATSNIKSDSGVLVYADNVDERQLIASILISNDYFAVMAISKKDLLLKAKDKDNYDRIVYNSYFSNIHDDVAISFTNNIFIYEFQGTLDHTLSERINTDDFNYRLTLGYNVIVFDFTGIYHLNLKASYFIIELEKMASSFDALICCIGLNEHKIDPNASATLEKGNIWIFEDLNHVAEDEEVIQKTESKLPTYSTGISKKLLELIPYFMASSLQALKLYGFKNTKKSTPKQIGMKELSKVRPSVVTHISFLGDFEGEFFFLFKKNSAYNLVTNVLVGIDDYDVNDFLDAMSEFVNSLTGKLKSTLRKHNKCIQFDLPYSSTSINDFFSPDSEQRFIFTNFEYEDEVYYVALTSPIEGL